MKYGFLRYSGLEINIYCESVKTSDFPAFVIKRRKGLKEVLLRLEPLPPMKSSVVKKSVGIYGDTSWTYGGSTTNWSTGTISYTLPRSFAVGIGGNNNR